MRSSYQIIDDKGRVWQEGSAALRAETSGFVAGAGFVDYVIRNMGFIGMRRVGNGIELRMRLDCVSEAAIIAATYHISDGTPPPSRIALTHWADGRWQFELHLGLAQLMARLARSTSLGSARRQKRTVRARREIDDLVADDKFRLITQAWEAAKPRTTSGSFMSDLAVLSDNRYTVFVKDPFAGFRVSDFGSNLPDYALKWIGSGQSALHQHPDRDYAWACERSFAVAIEKGSASLEEIDAVVQWRAGSPEMPIRRKYQCLLLPLLDDSPHGLISITREKSTIDVRA